MDNDWQRSDLSNHGLGRALILGTRPDHVCLSRLGVGYILTDREGTSCGDDLDYVLGDYPPPCKADLWWLAGRL